MKFFNTAPPEFPCTLKSDITFRIGLPAFAAYGLFGAYINYVHRSYATLTIVTALVLILLALTVAAYSYSLKVDDDGLQFAWVMGKRSAKWTDIVRLERTKNTFALYNKDNQEIVPLSVIPYAVQKAIADKALEVNKLKHDDKKQKYPILEQWTR